MGVNFKWESYLGVTSLLLGAFATWWLLGYKGRAHVCTFIQLRYAFCYYWQHALYKTFEIHAACYMNKLMIYIRHATRQTQLSMQQATRQVRQDSGIRASSGLRDIHVWIMVIVLRCSYAIEGSRQQTWLTCAHAAQPSRDINMKSKLCDVSVSVQMVLLIWCMANMCKLAIRLSCER